MRERNVTYLLQAYLLAIPYLRLFFLPVVSAKLQLTEIVFLLLFPLALLRYGRKLFDLPLFLMLTIGMYLLANLFSGFYSGGLEAILESFGRVYLVLVALVIICFVRYETLVKNKAELLVQSWSIGALTMAGLTMIGMIAATAGWNNILVVVYENYPYFGTVIRAKGLAGGANSLVYVCLLPLLYTYRRARLSDEGWLWVCLLLTICLATISKEIVIVILGLFLVDPLVYRKMNVLRPVAIVLTALVLWFGTHLIVQRPNDVTGTYLEGTEYTSEKIVWRGENVQLLETSYAALKKVGVIVASKNLLAGVGPGQFNSTLPREKELGNYPKHLPDYDPHSTLIGGFSETGLPGGISLLLMCGAGFWYTRRSIFSEQTRSTTWFLPVRVFLLLLLISSVSVDIMNFRHLWVPVAILLGVALSPNVTPIPPPKGFTPPL